MHLPSSTPATRFLKRKTRGAFSFIELMMSVTVLAIIAALAIKLSATAKTGVKSTKITADVQKLNQVVSVYLANGGSLDGITDPQAVLNKLKTIVTATETSQNVGVMTGTGVDNRLVAQLQSSAEVNSSLARAVWDSTNKKFYVSTSPGTAGISAFVLDSNLAANAPSYDTRTQSNETYNSTAGWVWAPGVISPIAALTPSDQALLDQENKFDPLNPSSGSPPGSSTPTLPTPIINPPGGQFFPQYYPGAVFINPNGAPDGTSVLKYQLNGGAWIIYNGPFSVPSGTRVCAKNFTTNSTVYQDSSPVTSGYYRLVPTFTGNIDAYWLPSSGPSGMVSTLYNNNPDDVEEVDGRPASGYNYGPNSFDFKRVAAFSGVPPNTDFKMGNLLYHNGTIVSGTGATTIHLHIDITMSSPSVAETGASVNIQLDNTLNVDNGNNSQSADYATLTNPTTNYSISIDGVTYTLQVHYGNIDVSQGYVSGNTLAVWEGATGTTDLFGSFVSSTPP